MFQAFGQRSTARSKRAGIPTTHIPSLFFSSKISLRLPHDLKAWNRLSCLPSLHNYLEIDGIVPQIRKKSIGLFLTADFQINGRLFQLVQSFISLSNRFCQSVSCCLYVFLYLFLFFFLFFRFFVCVFDRDVHLYFLNIQCKQRKLSR